MSTLKNLTLLSAGALSIFGCTTTEKNEEQTETSPQKPNIIFMMTDDHAQQAISAYGSELINTPNIDRLANEGMLFNHAYVTNSISAPSRAVILTGKYSHKNGVLDNKTPFDGSQQTYPKLLKNAGYQTAMFGKWHLKTAPTGFDHWKILPGQGNYYNPWFVTNGDTAQETGYVTDLITDATLKWLKEDRDENKPFMLMFHHKAPHRAWFPALKYIEEFTSKNYPVPATFWDDYENRGRAAKEAEMRIAEHMWLAWDLKVKPKDPLTIKKGAGSENNYRWMYKMMNEKQRQQWDMVYDSVTAYYNNHDFEKDEETLWKYQRYMQDYLACVASVDDNISRLLTFLDENDLAENTLVVYTSDQGFYLGEHGWFDKRFMYEESFHTPLIMRWPQVIKPNTKNNDFVMNLDFAETFLDVAGVSVPDDMQGKSLLPLLKGETPDDWRKSMYYHYYEYPGGHSVKRHYGIKTGDYKLIHFYYDIDEWELYDLKNDPNEMNNVINDSAYADIVVDLKKQLKGLENKYGDSEELRQQYINEKLNK